jgi:hypothetical protein
MTAAPPRGRDCRDLQLQQTNGLGGKVSYSGLSGDPMPLGGGITFRYPPAPHTSREARRDPEKTFYNDLTMKRQEI